MFAKLTKGMAWQNAGVTLLARCVANNGATITPLSVASITYNLVNLSANNGPATILPTTSLVAQNVLFNVYQTGPIWTEDTIGYNLAVPISASLLTVANANYRAEVWIHPADLTEPLVVPFEFMAQRTYGP